MRRNARSLRWLGALALFASACITGPYLVPAPQAVHLSGNPNTGTSDLVGVRLVVTNQQWDGMPVDLANVVTPLYVVLENHSGIPLRVRYQDLEVTGPTGFRVAALPPYQIQRPSVVYPATAPFYPSIGFYIAPPYSAYYPGLPLWGGPYDYDLGWYDSYASWQPALPTADMLRKAILEGVLQDGGNVSGFLYLPRIDAVGQEVRISFKLVNANTGKEFGQITVPLLVRK